MAARSSSVCSVASAVMARDRTAAPPGLSTEKRCRTDSLPGPGSPAASRALVPDRWSDATVCSRARNRRRLLRGDAEELRLEDVHGGLAELVTDGPRPRRRRGGDLVAGQVLGRVGDREPVRANPLLDGVTEEPRV